MASVTGRLMAQLLYQHRLRPDLGEQKRRESTQFLGLFRQGFGHFQHRQSMQNRGETGSSNPLARPTYPTLTDVQPRCGRRQLIPSSSMASCAGVSAI